LNVGSDGQVKDGGLTLGFGFGPTSNLPALVIRHGRVSIGAGENPVAKLDVAGTVKIADGTQGANKVLTSDATGMASWQVPAGGAGGISCGAGGCNANRIPKFSSGTAIQNSQITDDGNFVGIGVPVASSKLDIGGNLEVNGNAIITNNIKIGGGNPGDGKVLVSDADGDATWQNSSSVVGMGSGTLNDGGVIPIPSGFMRSQCKIMVSPGSIANSDSSKGIDTIVATAVPNTGVVTCRHSYEDDSNLYTNSAGVQNSCNYMIMCSR
jgi:hypothetical protein